LPFRPVVAVDLIFTAHRHIHVPRHGELHTPTLGQCVVGQALQLTVGFRVNLEEAQRSFVAQEALPPNRMVLGDTRRHSDHARLHRDQHLLAHWNPHELLGHLGNIIGGMEQHLFGGQNIEINCYLTYLNILKYNNSPLKCLSV